MFSRILRNDLFFGPSLVLSRDRWHAFFAALGGLILVLWWSLLIWSVFALTSCSSAETKTQIQCDGQQIFCDGEECWCVEGMPE